MRGLRNSAGLHLAAALAGAGGMGAQALLLAKAGLTAGQSVAGAFGPAAYVVGWALGAAWAGRSRNTPERVFALGALLSLALLALPPLVTLSGSGAFATAVALASVAVAALPSGGFLPTAARAHAALRERARLGSLLTANLAGALGGAWLIGFEATAQWGRTTALGIAVGSLCAAFASAHACSRALRTVDVRPPSAARDVPAGVVVAATTLWSLGLEWICLRVAVMWVGSEAAQLCLVVALSLLALALGASVSRWIPQGRVALGVWLVLCAGASTWPLWAAGALNAARPHGDVALSLALVVPTLLPFGALLPLLHASAVGESGRRLGDLLSFEVFGALAAGPLLHSWWVPSFGIAGTLAALCSLAALSIVAARWRSGGVPVTAALVAACVGIGLLAARAEPPALRSPKLTDPALSVLSFREDEHFSVTVVDDGVLGERTLLTDQFRAAGTGPDYRYMRALGHLPVLLHPRPARVAVLALGTGTTLGSVALHTEVERIDVLEISSAVVEAAPFFRSVNQGALEPRADRVRVIVDDGRRTLARSQGAYDVVTMEPLLPDSPFGVYLYTPEFYAVARRALASAGVFCQWIPPHALQPDAFDALLDAFARSFAHSQAWLFGTQIVLIGSERELSVAAERFRALAPRCVAALVELGIDSPAALASRHVASLGEWPASPRELSDDDPWIAWRRKPSDLRVLEWLPVNLERLTQRGSRLQWGAPERDAALESLREARIVHAWSEVELRRGTLAPEAATEKLRLALEPIPKRLRADPEVRSLIEEVAFLSNLRAGVAVLATGDAEAALPQLLRAAELRPERGDVHAAVAAALWAGGQEAAARAAARRAVETCPRIAETVSGERALKLGLPPDLLAR